jgi:AraC-like DNA-binding protein
MKAKLEQHIATRFIWSEKRDAAEIHCRLLRAFQKDTSKLSSVYESTTAFKIGRTSVLDEARARAPQLDHIGSKILSLFTANEFHSVRTLAQELGISSSTVHNILVHLFGF